MRGLERTPVSDSVSRQNGSILLRMSVSGFVSFVSPETGKNWVVKASELVGLSAQQILKRYQDDELHGVVALGLRTSIRTLAITNATPVLRLCQQLVMQEKPFDYERVPVALVMLQDIRRVILCCGVEVITQNEDFITLPAFEVSINPAEVTNARALLDVLRTALCMENEEKYLKVNGRKVNESYQVRELIRRESRVTYVCSMNETTLVKIRDRGKLSEEFVETEKTYVAKLKIMLKFWGPHLMSDLLLPTNDIEQIMKAAGSMLRIHNEFLTDLIRKYDGYASCYSVVFMKWAHFFKASKQFIALTQKLTCEIEKIKKRDGAVADRLEELFMLLRQDLVDPEDLKKFGNNFLGYLIEPAQRIMRYTLLLNQLLKDTPLSHPDAQPLSVAVRQVQVIIDSIDDESDRNQKDQEVIDLQSNLEKSYRISDQPRKIEFRTRVTIEGRHAHNTMIYVFSDIICIMEQERPKSKIAVLADALIEKFHCIEYGNRYMIIPAISVIDVNRRKNHGYLKECKELEIVFNTTNDFEMFKMMWHNRRKAMIKAKLTDTPYIKWTRQKTKVLPFPLCGHALVQDGEMHMTTIFGGKMEDMSCNRQFLSLDPDTYALTSAGSFIEGITKCTVNVFNSVAFIIGGKSGGKLRKGVGCYDMVQGSGSTVELSNADAFGPRTGHTTLCYDKRLWIFGGKGRKKVYNEMNIFSLESLEMNVIKFAKNSGTPCARYGHSACADGSKMYIFGGHGKKGTLNDLWCYDMLSSGWTRIELTGSCISHRYKHFATILGEMMIVFGGITETDDHCALVVHLPSGLVKLMANVGRVPANLACACACRRTDGSFCVVGGRENMSRLSGCIYDVRFMNLDHLNFELLRTSAQGHGISLTIDRDEPIDAVQCPTGFGVEPRVLLDEKDEDAPDAARRRPPVDGYRMCRRLTQFRIQPPAGPLTAGTGEKAPFAANRRSMIPE